jgi:Uma2 family endonuclease
MATTLIPTRISVDEYLKTSARPDCEYVRGIIKERAAGELDHASWQAALLHFFGDREPIWNIRVYPELRVQVAADNYRVPDVTILSRNAPREQIVTQPPLAVFEILSPTDTMTDMLERLADYQQMGIPAIWVIEPKKPSYYLYSSGQLTSATIFELPGISLNVPMSEIAAVVD